MIIKDFDKTLEMGRRVYNSKMISKEENGKVTYSDESAIKALCSKIFTKDGEVTNMEDLRSFNKIIVEIANEEAKAKFEQVVNLVSDFKSVGRYDAVQYNKVPSRTKTTMALSASGTSVDFTRIPSTTTKIPAVPRLYQFGVKYQISEMVNDPVNAFRNAIDFVVEEKVKFIFKQIMKLARVNKGISKIPAEQHKSIANLTLKDYRKIESKLIRAGKNIRPVMIADINFINELALKQGEEGLGTTKFSILTDELRTSLLRDVIIEEVSKSVAIATDNPFIDDENSKVEMEPQEALILAGGEGKPFKITEYGGLRTAQDMPSIEKEEVLMKIDYSIDVTLFNGKNIAYIKDTAITV